jgi:hypothetical protein
MFSRVRRRLTYANVVFTLALVFAMSGGAYAASRYVITSTKQISPKVLKALAGKNGAAGAVGAQGAPGAAGAAGAAGGKGEAGTNGTDGTDGANGTSVTSKTLAKGNANCEAGGSEFTAAEGKKTYACSGKEGSPWTDGGVLPSEQSEKGEWAASFNAVKGGTLAEQIYAPISFTIPLQETSAAHVIEEGDKGAGGGSGCPATSSVETPEAEPGNLCIFIGEARNAGDVSSINDETKEPEVAGKVGARVVVIPEAEGAGRISGTWAVTAK